MKTLDNAPVAASHGPKGDALHPPVPRPLFVADWLDALFMHFEIEPRELQPVVPYKLDLWQGRAVISLVAFTMRGMRLAPLGKLGAWLCRSIATHPF